MIGEENKPPYTFVWRTPAPGTYTLSVQATDNHGLQGTSAPVFVIVGAGLGPSFPGTITREFWHRRPSNTLAMLTNYAYYPNRPTGREYLAIFEIATNRADYYAAKISGYVHPPATGPYVFWIAADDVAQLWLSTDEQAANKQLIASVFSSTQPRQWTAQTSQQSVSIPLQAGRRYYIEALHKEATTIDHLAVGWQLPDGLQERPIPGTRLSPTETPHRPMVHDVVVTEGDSGAATAIFLVMLLRTNSATVTVNYTTLDGSAAAGVDYIATSGALTFHPGESNQTVSVSVRGNLLGEPDKTFFLLVTDSANPQSFASARATIVNDDLFIVQHPQSLAVRGGSNATLNVVANSGRPITYQWRLNGMDLPNQTTAFLNIVGASLAHDGTYTVALTDGVSSLASTPATVSVLINPAITLPPLSQSVVQGGSATFSVAFTGSPQPFGVDWRRGSLTRVSNTVARLHDFFTLTNAQASDAGTWRVWVKNQANTNTLGEVRTFTLTVLADNDGDGLPDAWEAAYSATDPALDPDHDGLTTLEEYQSGTDPTNALSYLKVNTIALTNDGNTVRLTFFAVSNKTYTVQSSQSLPAGMDDQA